jgi:ribosomal-protein-alanine N-acetyltransferase
MPALSLPHCFPFTDPELPYEIRPMRASDLRQVMTIERAAFPAPWPVSAYRYELTRNDLSTYLVLCLAQQDPGGRWTRLVERWAARSVPPVLGYGGLWMLVDEAHISTLAVHPEWRGRGLGELLLVALIEVGALRGAARSTLEVRVSNLVAQSLYAKYAFVQEGRRKHYYHDNNEDALIMTTPRMDSAHFASLLETQREQLRQKLLVPPTH